MVSNARVITRVFKELEHPNILRCILLIMRNHNAEVFTVFLVIVCGLTFWLIFSPGAQQAFGVLDVDKEVKVFKRTIENLNGWISRQNVSDPSFTSQTYSSLITSNDEIETNPSENQDSKKLNLDINFAKDPIKVGNVEKVTATVTRDDNSNEISGANVDGLITYVSGLTKSFSGTSDTNGEVSHSWAIDKNSVPGIYQAKFDASMAGFVASSESKSFEVQPKSEPKSSSSTTSDSSSQTDDSSDSKSRCPDGFHRSPSGDCEKVTNTKNLPRCDNGYHRSPSGHCEKVQ